MMEMGLGRMQEGEEDMGGNKILAVNYTCGHSRRSGTVL
jgi:hypothetical protein